MALIKCPECGRDVSDSAITCPNCGRIIFHYDKKATNAFEVQCRKCERFPKRNV